MTPAIALLLGAIALVQTLRAERLAREIEATRAERDAVVRSLARAKVGEG